jgi:hypothetical protein
MRVLFVTVGMAAMLAAPALAQDEKAELINQLQHDSFLKARSAVLIDKLVDFKMSPKWWDHFTNDQDARNSMSNMVDTLSTVANAYGWGDVDALDSTRDQTSPIYLDTVGSWKDKLHMTIVMDQDLDAKGMALAMEKFNTIINPLAYAKPRGNKYFVTVKMDPKAKAFSYKGNKERTHYTMVFPVYMPVSQSAVQDAVQRAN